MYTYANHTHLISNPHHTNNKIHGFYKDDITQNLVIKYLNGPKLFESVSFDLKKAYNNEVGVFQCQEICILADC